MTVLDSAERYDRGLQHLKAGRTADAEGAFEALLAMDPADPNAANLLGLVRKKQGRALEAEALFRRAVAGLGDAAGFRNNLGSALRLQGRVEEAIQCYREALRLHPGDPDATLNLVRLLQPLGEYLEALALLEAAVQAAPRDAELWAELGRGLALCGDGRAALRSHSRSLELDPGCAAAWNALGSTWLILGDAEAAVRALDRSRRLDPANDANWAALLMARQYILGTSPEELASLHREQTQHAFPQVPPAAWGLDADPDRRLRIGLLSPDLRDHSVGSFLRPLLEHHDPARLDLLAYSTASLAKSDGSQAFRPHFSLWRDSAWMDSEQLAACIREDRVDVLVELAGHTEGSRLDVIARRPAPVQVFWLGYPGTTGMDAFQGRLTDAWVDPPGEERLSAEPPVRLARGFHCFAPEPDSPPVSGLPALANGTVTFASFNNLAKLNTEVLDLWATLLRRLPGSRLVLKSNRNGDPFPMERVQERLQEAGVAPYRLVMMGRIEGKAAHLAQYQDVDIALDPFPYNGVTTTCEALWMGVPVVTLRGDRNAGRYGASLLHQANLDELVAEDPQQYLALALGLAQDLPRLAGLRSGMRARLLDSPLLDGRDFASRFEQAVRGLWTAWCRKP